MAKATLLPNHGHATCETVDHLPPAARALVHEFGYSVVRAFDMAGVRDPRTIRRLIYAVWFGAREPGNKRAAGEARPFVKTLNATWPHLRNAEAMLEFLRAMKIGVAPLEPTPDMVAASMAEMGKHAIVSKEMKHRLRLRAAISAAQVGLGGADG